MVDSNFLYDENKDFLYILIYKLGKGANSIVWFSLEIENFFSKMKNKKNLIFNPRALKVHFDDSYEQGIVETEINSLIIDLNKKKCSNINYPLSHFIHDETYVIVVYEVAIGSLYDIMKEFNKKLPLDFVYNIVPKLIKPIEFMHKCKYTHTDIKPENYLLMGLSQLQKDIISFANNYGFADKIRKIANLKNFKNSNIIDENIQKPFLSFLNSISKRFNLSGNILNNDNDSDDNNEDNNNEDNNNKDNNNEDDKDNENNSNSDNDSQNSQHSFYSNISDEENESDYETVSSYDSRDNEYFEDVDIFHKEKIIKILFNKEIKKNNKNTHNNSTNTNNNAKIKKENKIKYLLEVLNNNPIIKLTDFGLMKHFKDTKYTIQTRYYRSPEIILGLKFNEQIDLWSLGCTIYELSTGKILFYTCKNELIDKYDVDLLHIKMIFEKIGTSGQEDLFKLISCSKRKKYILNKNNCFNFIGKLNNNLWDNDLLNLINHKDYKNVNIDHIKYLINIIENSLQIIPKNRKLII